MRPAEEYVLKPFRSDDEFEAEAMVKHGADALANLLVRGLNHTMNHFNS
jgi:peptidyl-tRNA hydrolase